jgi:hypothetical protein
VKKASLSESKKNKENIFHWQEDIEYTEWHLPKWIATEPRVLFITVVVLFVPLFPSLYKENFFTSPPANQLRLPKND